MRVIGWTYDADVHCDACAEARFGEPGAQEDTEGNPIRPIFETDEQPEGGYFCGDCGAELE